MRTIVIGFLTFTALATVQAHAAALDVNSSIDDVTVYPDGASVTRLIKVDLPAGENTAIARDFPLTMDVSSLRVEGEAGAKLTIGSIDARPPRAAAPVNLPEIDRKIEALRDERVDLQGTIDAAKARRRFAERFAEASPAGIGEKGEARPLTEWRSAFAAVGEEIASADVAIRAAERKQREIDREIAQLEGDRAVKPPRRMEVRVELSSPSATQATLRVTYTVRNTRWAPLYDARLDSGSKDRKPSIELVRRAEITQTTGEDWQNVALAVSTVRTARGGNAPDLGTLVVQYPQVPRPVAAGSVRRDRDMAQSYPPVSRALTAKVAEDVAAPAPAEEQQAVAEVGSYQVVFRIPGRVSVGASEGAKSLRIASSTITPDLSVRAVPVLDPTAFLEASFKQTEDAPLLGGRVAIYRDGIFVGRGQMATAGKDETVRLGFGADDKVKIERNIVRRNEGTSGFIVGTSKTDERSFKTIVRNGHDFPIKVAIEDQLPVSENEDIKVEMLSATTPPTATDLRDRRGVLQWSFDAKAGEARDINFAWRVLWPKDKNVVMQPSG